MVGIYNQVNYPKKQEHEDREESVVPQNKKIKMKNKIKNEANAAFS